MADLDIEKLSAVLTDKNTAGNAKGIMDMLQEANKVLTELQKSTNILNQMGIFPALVRIMGAKYNVDVETPLGYNFKKQQQELEYNGKANIAQNDNKA